MKFKKGDVIRFSIKTQGAPIVNKVYLIEAGENIVALSIDLKSKYCYASEMAFNVPDGGCGIAMHANKESLGLKEDVGIDEKTEIQFDDFDGWRIFAFNSYRYTCDVCLIRE